MLFGGWGLGHRGSSGSVGGGSCGGGSFSGGSFGS